MSGKETRPLLQRWSYFSRVACYTNIFGKIADMKDCQCFCSDDVKNCRKYHGELSSNKSYAGLSSTFS